MNFPFPTGRARGIWSYQFYRAISRKKRLVYPGSYGDWKDAFRYFPGGEGGGGEEKGDKIFYLTAKTVTRTVAEEAFRILRSLGLTFTSVTITAKEKLCFLEKAGVQSGRVSLCQGTF